MAPGLFRSFPCTGVLCVLVVVSYVAGAGHLVENEFGKPALSSLDRSAHSYTLRPGRIVDIETPLGDNMIRVERMGGNCGSAPLDLLFACSPGAGGISETKWSVVETKFGTISFRGLSAALHRQGGHRCAKEAQHFALRVLGESESGETAQCSERVVVRQEEGSSSFTQHSSRANAMRSSPTLVLDTVINMTLWDTVNVDRRTPEGLYDIRVSVTPQQACSAGSFVSMRYGLDCTGGASLCLPQGDTQYADVDQDGRTTTKTFSFVKFNYRTRGGLSISNCGCTGGASGLGSVPRRISGDINHRVAITLLGAQACLVQIQAFVTPSCKCVLGGEQSCKADSSCACPLGVTGAYCNTPLPNPVPEVVNNASRATLTSNMGSMDAFWVQVSRSNTQVQVQAISLRNEWGDKSDNDRNNEGTAVILAKWGSMPTINQTTLSAITIPIVADFECSDCDFRLRGPFVDGLNLTLKGSDIPNGKENERLYVAMGLVGEFIPTTRKYLRKVTVEDSFGGIVSTVYFMLFGVSVAFVLFSLIANRNPQVPLLKAEELLGGLIARMEHKLLYNMRVSGVNRHIHALEQEDRTAARHRKAESERKAAAKTAGVEMGKVGAAEAAVEAGDLDIELKDDTVSGGAGGGSTVGFWTGLVVVIFNMVSLLAGVVKTVFNISLMASSFSKVLPGYRVDLVYAQFSLALELGPLGDLAQLFLDTLRSLDFTIWANEWNCGGLSSLLSPLFLLLGMLLLRVMLKRDVLLLLSMFFKSLKKRQGGAIGKAASTLAGNLVVGGVFYLTQIIIATIGDMSLSLGGVRNCGEDDLAARQMGSVLMVIMLVVFFVTNFDMFSGTDWKWQNRRYMEEYSPCRKDVKQQHWIVVALANLFPMVLIARVVRGLERLLKLSVGVWTTDQVRAFKVLPRSNKFDDDKWDVDSQQEPVVATVGRAASLVWLMFPGPLVVIGKFTEALNNPPVFDVAKKSKLTEEEVEAGMGEDEEDIGVSEPLLRLHTPKWSRAVKYVANMINMAATVLFVVSLDSTVLLVALGALVPGAIMATLDDLRG